MYVLDAICTSANNHCFSTGGRLTIKHELVPGLASIGALTGISRSEDFRKLLVLFRHSRIPRRSALISDNYFFKQNRPVPVQCVETLTVVTLILITLRNDVRAQ